MASQTQPYSDTAVLQFILKNNILQDREAIEEEMKKADRAKHLAQHRYSIWLATGKNEWITYVPDESKPRKKRKVARKTKEQLEDYLLDFYHYSQPLIKDVYKEWIERKRSLHDIKTQTADRYHNAFLRFFPDDNPICKKHICDIQPYELEEFIENSIVNHQLTKKTYGMLTILINGIWTYAKKRGYTTIAIKTFMAELSLPKNLFAAKEKKDDAKEVFTEHEITRIKTHVFETREIRDLGVLFTFYTGLRVGELAALRTSDIKRENGNCIIHISKTEIHYKNPETLKNFISIQETPKTEAGNRDILISREGAEVLDLILSLYPTTNGYLFEDNGERITSRGFSNALAKICNTLDIPPRSMHTIRRTYGTLLLKNDVPAPFIEKQMGHSNIQVTYSHYYKDNDTTDIHMSKINSIFNSI